MITLLVYLVINFVLITIAFRFWFRYREHKNTITFYFMNAVAILALGQTLNIISIILYLWLGNPAILYWGDYLGRIALFASTLFFIQLPLLLLFPKSKKRYLASYALAIIGVGLFAYFLNIPYTPILGSDGIINWATPASVSIPLGVIQLLVMVSASGIFFYEFYKSKYKTIKLLVSGLGFFLASVGGVLQDYANTRLEYVLVNLLLVVAFVLIFIGAFIKDKN